MDAKELEQFKADAKAKNDAWTAHIVPRMRAVRDFYNAKHGAAAK